MDRAAGYGLKYETSFKDPISGASAVEIRLIGDDVDVGDRETAAFKHLNKDGTQHDAHAG